MDLSLSQNFEDLLAIDKSRYFAQPHLTVVKYSGINLIAFLYMKGFYLGVFVSKLKSF